jgi:polyhydroxyalkanoate synthesis regulator phasin
MAGLGDLVQKAIYLGVGMADYAAERAGITFQELKVQAQKIADEMVGRGEMSVDEARKYVDELIKQAQDPNLTESEANNPNQSSEPRRIEISTGESQPDDTEKLRRQVESLQEELRRLQRE